MELKLRPTVISGDKPDNDFVVLFEDRSIGRIRQADERRHPAAAEKRKGVPGWITICSVYVLWIALLCTGFVLLIRWLGG